MSNPSYFVEFKGASQTINLANIAVWELLDISTKNDFPYKLVFTTAAGVEVVVEYKEKEARTKAVLFIGKLIGTVTI